nr:hypothetical protein [Tanacetum cinerariifolium]
MQWRHQDSSVADPSPTGVRAEDIRSLCENVIDLRPVHPTMLYAIGLTTIWKHVGHHLIFYRWIVEYENERVLAVKRKDQAAKDRVAAKRVATEGASQRPKNKKTSPLSFALLDFEADGSPRSGSGTHHFASPLNTIIPNEAELTTKGDDLILESVNQAKEDTDRHPDHVEDTIKVNSPFFEPSPRSQHSNPSDEDAHNVRDETADIHASGLTGRVRSSSGGSHRQTFPRRNPGGDGIGSSLRGNVGLPVPFVPVWNLTTHSNLNDAESCRDRYEALNEDYEELYESHQSCRAEDHKALQQVHLGCVGKEADLTEKLATVKKARDDLLDKDRKREEHIKQLETDLASKTSSLTEAGGVVNTLKGDLERLTRLLSNGEYKKSLTNVFNLAIAAGSSEGVKAACSEEEAGAFRLPSLTMTHYTMTPLCLSLIPFSTRVTHMWRSWLSPFGFLWGIYRNVVGRTSCTPGNMRHLAIGSWTHPECLAFRVMCITRPLALGLVWNVLRFG